MTIFASANAFTGSNGAELNAVNAAFVKVHTCDNAIIQSNRLIAASTAAPPTYRHTAAPPSADYQVSTDLYIAGTTSTAVSSGPMARMVDGERTGYWLRWRRGTGWQLFRYNTGTATQLGSTVGPTTYAAASLVRATVRCAGSVIKGFVDGAEIISVTDASPIAAAGYAGLIASNTLTTDGPHIANFTAETLEATVAGGTGTGTGSGSGGDAATGGNAAASGGTGTGTGTGAGGSAVGVDGTVLVKTDAIWTWFTDPRAVHYNGATYIGWITTSGSVGVSRFVHATQTVTSFTLSVNLQADDHNNPAIHILPDGRIAAFYCKHNDAGGHRYRISTNPEDISAWGAETLISSGITLPVTYANPRRLSQDPSRLWLFYRAGAGASTDNGLHYKTTTDLAAWDAQVAVWKNVVGGAVTPYYKIIDDGVKRIHFVATDRHPVGGQSSVYHWYMELDGSNIPHWYTTDGTEIVSALPHGPSVATLVSDGSTVRRWIWDIALDAAGNPRILGTRYPNNDGTDIRYMLWRWTGSAWAETEICPDGTGLYSPEIYYAGGLCFDSLDCNRIYLSAPISGVREIQEWQSLDNGATWAKLRDITAGTSAGTLNARPYSPRNHHSALGVLWWRGSYTSFTSYATNVYGASASFDGAATAPGGVGTSTGSGSGGVASGGVSAYAPGGVGSGTGSGVGGDSAWGGAGIAPGGTGISGGSGNGGSATGGVPVALWAVLPDKRTESRLCKTLNLSSYRALNIITPPSGLPVSVQNVKDAGARVDGSELDLQIELAIRALTDKAEAILHRPLITRTYELVLDGFPACEIDMQVPNVSVVRSVDYLDESAASRSVQSDRWAVLGETLTTWLFSALGTTWPATLDAAGAVRIRFDAGFGVDGASVPDSIRLWIIANVIANLDNPSGVRNGEWKSLEYADGLLDCWKTYRS